MIKEEYHVKAKVWMYSGAAAWHFISIPKKQSKGIKDMFDVLAGGWGSLPVIVTIGKTRWKTSIFPDKKSGTYLLPLKADVRKKEKIHEGKVISPVIKIIT